MQESTSDPGTQNPVSSFKHFETERLLLRPTGIEDASFILALMNTPKWLQYIGDRGVNSIKKAKKYIRTRMQPQLERLGFANYTVIRKTDGEKLGNCGLYEREGLLGIDLGFAFLPEHEGQGYAYEAASRLLRAAREEFGLKTIYGITDPGNLPSQKLLEKLGFVRDGSIRLPGETEEVFLYVSTSEG